MDSTFTSLSVSLWSFSMLIVGRGIKFVSDMEVDLEKFP